MAVSRLLVVLLIAGALVGGGWAATTPSEAVPVGIGAYGGGSMTPTYPEAGHYAYVDKGYSNVKIGDVVAFRTDRGGIIIHRVVDRTPKGYVTKGDDNVVSDQPPGAYVTRENYIGTVVWAG